jgi:DNA end-binding protein Ku
MSSTLVDQFSGDFEPEKFADEYQEQLRELVDAKLEEGESVDTEATFGEEATGDDSEQGGNVVSLMDALERSVQRRRGSGSGSSSAGKKDAKPSGSRTKSGSNRSSKTQSSNKRSSGSKKSSGAKKKSAS